MQNAVPLLSFDNAMPTYQVLKSLLRKMPDLSFDKKDFMVVSPDEGAMNRNMYFSSVLGCNLGMFYKRRDYTTVVNGRNPIVAHEYLGESVEGKTVFVADDIVASGDSMLEVGRELKKRGAARIIADATFPLFTAGLGKFDAAVEEGALDFMVGTNLTYRKPELLQRDWYLDVDVSKYAAYFVLALNHDISVSAIADPIRKIEALLAKHADQEQVRHPFNQKAAPVHWAGAAFAVSLWDGFQERRGARPEIRQRAAWLHPSARNRAAAARAAPPLIEAGMASVSRTVLAARAASALGTAAILSTT